jgi:hypothetical protein
MLIVSLATTLLVASPATSRAQERTPVRAAVDSESRADVLGETTLTGEVHRVIGPRLFTIAAQTQLGDALVFVPGARVAAISTGAAVVVTGMMRLSTAANLDNEWGSFQNENARHSEYPMLLVAERLTSNGVDAAISAAARAVESDTPLATASERALTDVDALGASADTRLVGRAVHLRNVAVQQVVSGGGFCIVSGGEELFVRPADESHLRDGQRVNLKGVVLELPERMANRLGDSQAARDETIYVYASQIRTR